MINKHKNLPSTMFKACAHGNITKPKVWMSKGTNKDTGEPSRDTINTCATEFLNACIPVKIFPFVFLLVDVWGGGGGGYSGCAEEGTEVYVYDHLNQD